MHDKGGGKTKIVRKVKQHSGDRANNSNTNPYRNASGGHYAEHTGKERANHKYVKRVKTKSGKVRYIYPEDLEKSGNRRDKDLEKAQNTLNEARKRSKQDKSRMDYKRSLNEQGSAKELKRQQEIDRKRTERQGRQEERNRRKQAEEQEKQRRRQQRDDRREQKQRDLDRKKAERQMRQEERNRRKQAEEQEKQRRRQQRNDSRQYKQEQKDKRERYLKAQYNTGRAYEKRTMRERYGNNLGKLVLGKGLETVKSAGRAISSKASNTLSSIRTKYKSAAKRGNTWLRTKLNI